MEKLLEYADAQREKGNSVLLLITGDHSQRNAHSMIHGNSLLEQMGLCKVENGKLVSWKACVDSGDGMAYVYLNHIRDEQEKAQLLARIREGSSPIRDRCRSGAGRIYPSGLRPGRRPGAGRARMVMGLPRAPQPRETSPTATAFPMTRPAHCTATCPRAGDYRTMLLACGDGVRHGTIPRMSIMDLLPTICKWMDIPLDGQVQGRVVEELFCEP